MLIKTVGQPIVNILTGEKVFEERLCQPGCDIREYFNAKNRNTLLRRELHAILQCIEESNGFPFNVNVTLYTLPYLCRLPISWNGGLELVEWELSLAPHFKQTRALVQSMQARGLSVWADDVTPHTLEMWLKVGVNGLKVEIEAIKNDNSFIDQLKITKLPIIIEKVETESQHEFIKNLGIVLAQGFYYGKPKENDKTEKIKIKTSV